MTVAPSTTLPGVAMTYSKTIRIPGSLLELGPSQPRMVASYVEEALVELQDAGVEILETQITVSRADDDSGGANLLVQGYGDNKPKRRKSTANLRATK